MRCQINKQYPKIYNAAIKQQMPSNKKCHQIPNTLPSGQISPNIKFHQICGVEGPNILNPRGGNVF